ncbi:MAG TPA: lysophospholipid acyltransferase family protein [Thermoanaerobaculia bacterium]|nr:lysophospholipid acyltransferase family protein [Thermoanaerobaculia bacterium]
MSEASGETGGFLRRLRYRIHFAAACLVGGFFFVAFSLWAVFKIAVLKRDRQDVMDGWIHPWYRIMSATLGWEMPVDGEERFETSRPAVIVINHQSNLDIVLWARFFPAATVIVGKKQIRKIPIFGYIFQGTRNILIDRENAERARRSLEDAARRIRTERLNVWMAPEGHRNLGAEMLPFKKGAFHLAVEAQVPVLPVVVGPVWSVFDGRRLLNRPGEIRTRILPPIPTEGLSEKDIDPLVTRVRAAMDEVRRELMASAGPRIG